MSEEIYQSKSERVIAKTTAFVSNKRNRSVLFLILSAILILGINALLPVIEGGVGYTAVPISNSYSSYLAMRELDPNIRLTWVSKGLELAYLTGQVPTEPMVMYYTKFFFQDYFWYISTITSISSALILFYGVFNYFITVMRERYQKYVKLEDELTSTVDKYIDPVTFEPWMDNTFNHRRKIQQHITNVKYKIDKLERKTHYKIKRQLRPYFETVNKEGALVPYGTFKLGWRAKQYLRKKEKLLYLLEESYIKEYVVNGRVKHFHYLYPMFVYSGENNSGHTVDNYSLLKTDTRRIRDDATGRIVLSIAITFLFAVLMTVTVMSSIEQQPLWIVINTIAKIAPLVIQIPLATDYSNDFMNKQLIGNLLGRRSIMLLYLADMKGGPANAPSN